MFYTNFRKSYESLHQKHIILVALFLNENTKRMQEQICSLSEAIYISHFWRLYYPLVYTMFWKEHRCQYLKITKGSVDILI
jgi:hypothetical protein